MDEDFDSVLMEFDESQASDEEIGPKEVIREAEFVEALDDFMNEKETYIPIKIQKIHSTIPQDTDAIAEQIEKKFDKFGNTKDDDEKEDNEDTEEEIRDMLQEAELIEIQKHSHEQWDCESIVTTYTNTENHPSLIAIPKKELKIRLNTKGIPKLSQQSQQQSQQTQQESQESEEEDDEEIKLNQGEKKKEKRNSRRKKKKEKKLSKIQEWKQELRKKG